MPKKNKGKRDFRKDDMRIYEVKDERPPLNSPPYNPNLPELPGILLFIMKCKSGKTNFIANYLNRPEYVQGVFDKVIIVSPTEKIDKSSQIYFREEVEYLYEIHDDAENVNEIIENIIKHQSQFDINDPDNLPPRICLLLDDISSYLKRDALVTHKN